MHSRKKYERCFVLLQPESGGFALEGRKLAGTALLEIINGKGKATVNIQGLKLSATGVCKMYMVSSKDAGSVGVCLGAVKPGAGGKASNVWDFDPDNVMGSGLGYDEFSVFAIIIKSAEISQKDIIAPLVGYKNGVVLWKGGFREYGGQKAQSITDDKQEGITEVIAEEATERISEKTMENSKENASENALKITSKIASDTATEELTKEMAEKSEKYATIAGYASEAICEGEAENAGQAALSENVDETFNPSGKLSAMLKGLLSAEELENAVSLHEKLKETVSAGRYSQFMKTLVTIAEYTPKEEHEQMVLSLAEASGITPRIPFGEREPLEGLFGAIMDYIPGKVKESAVSAFEDVLCDCGSELETFSSIIKSCAERFKSEIITDETKASACGFARENGGEFEAELAFLGIEVVSSATEQKEEFAGQKTGVVGQKALDRLNELRESKQSESGSTGFREAIREFNQRFDNFESLYFPKNKKESCPEQMNDRTEAASEVEETGSTAETTSAERTEGTAETTSTAETASVTEPAKKVELKNADETTNNTEMTETPKSMMTEATAAPGNRAKPREERPGEHGKFNDEKLYRLFEKHKKFEPFRFSDRRDHEKPAPYYDSRHRRPPYEHPHFPPVVPPVIPIYDINWIQIAPDDIYHLPERLWLYSSNPFVANGYRQYGHLILGVSGVLPGRVYYLGVPGVYSERDRMVASSLGFTSFMPAGGGGPRHGEFGYWILSA